MSPSTPNPPSPAIDHYENFPVASWLCPAALRPAVIAIYHFARTADDLADEGDAAPGERLADLARYRDALLACARGHAAYGRWAGVFGPLAAVLARHQLPLAPFTDLLSAFEQDVAFTRDRRRYENRTQLLDYCRRSANPIGRLMLHLYGVHDARAIAESDRICTALQLINFWQDLGIDLPRGRYYLPLEDCRAHGLAPDDAAGWADPAHWARQPAALRLVASEVAWARELMLAGAPLVHRVPGRAGWELRAVVQGGLRILDKIAAQGFDSFAARPRLGAGDAPLLLWRCLRMKQFAA